MSNKVKDKKNRWRSKVVGFRVSPEEWEQLEKVIKLSGLIKQDYITTRLLSRDIVVQGNPRVYKALRNQLARVLEQLQNITDTDGAVDDELLEVIKLMTITLEGLKLENN